MKECYMCSGSGKIRNNDYTNGKIVFRKIDCHVCNGTGDKNYKLKTNIKMAIFFALMLFFCWAFVIKGINL